MRPPVCAKEIRNLLLSPDRPRARQRDKFPAQHCSPEGAERWPKFTAQDQVNYSGHDRAVIEKKSEEPEIRKTNLKVWRDDRLQTAADSPKVTNLQPAPPIFFQQCDDDGDHRPIAQLHRQHLAPIDIAVLPAKDDVADVICEKHQRQRPAHNAVKVMEFVRRNAAANRTGGASVRKIAQRCAGPN